MVTTKLHKKSHGPHVVSLIMLLCFLSCQNILKYPKIYKNVDIKYFWNNLHQVRSNWHITPSHTLSWFQTTKPLHARQRSIKHQFYSLWFDRTMTWTYNLLHSKACMLIITPLMRFPTYRRDHLNIHTVFQLDFEIFRTIASFIKISSGHSLIIKLIFIKFFRIIWEIGG